MSDLKIQVDVLDSLSTIAEVLETIKTQIVFGNYYDSASDLYSLLSPIAKLAGALGLIELSQGITGAEEEHDK